MQGQDVSLISDNNRLRLSGAAPKKRAHMRARADRLCCLLHKVNGSNKQPELPYWPWQEPWHTRHIIVLQETFIRKTTRIRESISREFGIEANSWFLTFWAVMFIVHFSIQQSHLNSGVPFFGSIQYMYNVYVLLNYVLRYVTSIFTIFLSQANSSQRLAGHWFAGLILVTNYHSPASKY